MLFVWFCIVSTFGEQWWQIRGWPINWFLQLDPLVAIGTIFTTGAFYKPLLWALTTVILTILLGRFFCNWVCPFGSLHHFTGYLANRKKTAAQQIKLNNYKSASAVKYYILIIFLLIAAVPIAGKALLTGMLDPISLITRSFNLMLLPVADKFSMERFYEGAWLIFIVFFTAVAMNLFIPRFYCRFICPLGALFGIMGRFAIWRIGKRDESSCSHCNLCEANCQGGCSPAGKVRISECLLCFNCRNECRDDVIGYQTTKSNAGEVTNPDISRRGFVFSVLGGVLILPAMKLSNSLGANWNNKIIRPPGSLNEKEFLKRCIKCGQCMRVCPTNVIQPGSLALGVENVWTPTLNNRIGSSGCQLDCTACGYVCPTLAIRRITLSEKIGVKEFAEAGPIKIGTAFVDRSRCLAWAMDKPCIVCQENCPVSPKAIYTEEIFNTIRNGIFAVEDANNTTIRISPANLKADSLATGDYYCNLPGTNDNERRNIIANTENNIVISPQSPWKNLPEKGSEITIQIRLQRPYVDIEKCTGCGVCEHECPVSGKRAIRVSAEGQSREPGSSLLLKN